MKRKWYVCESNQEYAELYIFTTGISAKSCYNTPGGVLTSFKGRGDLNIKIPEDKQLLL